MLSLLKRINNKIPDNAPRPFVLGLMLWFAAATLMVISVVLARLEWMAIYQLVFSLMFIVGLGFIGCVVWFLIEFTIGRKTPWRRRENP